MVLSMLDSEGCRTEFGKVRVKWGDLLPFVLVRSWWQFASVAIILLSLVTIAAAIVPPRLFSYVSVSIALGIIPSLVFAFPAELGIVTVDKARVLEAVFNVLKARNFICLEQQENYQKMGK